MAKPEISAYLQRELRSELAYIAERYNVRFLWVATFDTNAADTRWQDWRLYARDHAEAVALAREHGRTKWKGSPWTLEAVADDYEAVLFLRDGKGMLRAEFEAWRQQVEKSDVQAQIGAAVTPGGRAA